MFHTTYATGGGLKDRPHVEKTRFGQYDFVFMFAGLPSWNAKDMDASREEVLDRVAKHAYPREEKGDGLVSLFVKKAHEGSTKVLISMTGDPVETAPDEGRLANYVELCKAFVKKYDYDGIEIDWEHKVHLPTHARLMQALRRGLNELSAEQGGRRYYLTTALHYWRRYDKALADTLSSAVDWVNVMCYDMGGGNWGGYAQDRATPSHNCPLNAMQADMDEWLKVFDPKKLLIGIANYGFYYKGLKPGAKGTQNESLRGCEHYRYIDWTEVSRLIEDGWREQFDKAARASYYFSPDGEDFVTIDNHRSHDYKLDWIIDKGFLGVFWWHFNSDFYPARPGEKYTRHELIDHVAAELDRRGLRPLDAAL